MKLLVAISAIFLLFALASADTNPAYIERMLESGRRGVMRTIVSNYRPATGTPDISIVKMHKVSFDRWSAGDMYTFVVDFKNNQIKNDYRWGVDQSICKVSFRVMYGVDGVQYHSMKKEQIACRLLKDSDDFLPDKFALWISD